MVAIISCCLAILDHTEVAMRQSSVIFLEFNSCMCFSGARELKVLEQAETRSSSWKGLLVLCRGWLNSFSKDHSNLTW